MGTVGHMVAETWLKSRSSETSAGNGTGVESKWGYHILFDEMLTPPSVALTALAWRALRRERGFLGADAIRKVEQLTMYPALGNAWLSPT
jgi:hypothetical protein